MREIKFRLIRDGEIVGYEKWYPGEGKPGDITSAAPCWLYSTEGEYWSPKYICHDSKDEYTGLNDKNGVDIYAGDILRHLSDNLVVFWQERQTRYILLYNDQYRTTLPALAGFMSEVVENIHETPE